MEPKEKFAGDKKEGVSLFFDAENQMVARTIRFIPRWIETYHLTMLTALWSGAIILTGFLARGDIRWLWFVSLMIVFQYITDLYDGKLGKYRNTGLIKWGYFMDHFLDYIFLGSIMFSYSFLVPAHLQFWGLAIVIIAIGFMVNSFLSFAATNKFRISYLNIGPTESRMLFILFNTTIIFFGKDIFELIPYATVIAVVALTYVVFRSHREIWQIDMEQNTKSHQ
jgi:phosphatidylglycerophosphate synthase